MDRAQRPVGILVDHRPQALEPGDHARGIADQGLDEIRIVAEASAANHIEVVHGRRIVFLVGGLDPALSHHRVGVAEAELGDQQHLGTVFLSQERGAGTRPATADDQADFIGREIFSHNGCVILYSLDNIPIHSNVAFHHLRQ